LGADDSGADDLGADDLGADDSRAGDGVADEVGGVTASTLQKSFDKRNERSV
jgi:hypothetical protein